MKYRRLSTLLLAFLTICSTACGSVSTEEDITGTTTADTTSGGDSTVTDELAPPELPEEDYDGYEFRILTCIEGWRVYNNENLVVEEENGEILNDAIYTRNIKIEDRFNINLTQITTTDDINNEVKQVVMAGDDAYDLVAATYQMTIGTEYLVDYMTLDYINLDKPWWNHNYIEANSVNGKLCSAVNSIMITHMDSVLGMFYNKQLAEENQLPDLYELVRSGDWTLGKFFEITKDVSRDINGDSVFDDNDLYSFVGLDGILRLGSGVKLEYAVKDENDYPTLNLEDEKLLLDIDQLRNYAQLYTNDIYDPRTDKNSGGDGDKAVFRMFTNDQAMFLVHGVGSAQMFRDMKSNFGVIPTPKLDESQENYFISPDMTKRLIIPVTASDIDRTSIIIEALAYEGYTYLRPLYYETMLQSKYLRDEESIEMLDEYIYTNIGFNVNTGSTKLTEVVNSVIKGSSEAASTFASNKSTIQSELDKYIELYE